MGTPVEIMLPTSVDLDTIVKNGPYYIGATPVNGPTESAANSQLLVVSGGTTSTQLIFIHSTGNLWVRTATNSVASASSAAIRSTGALTWNAGTTCPSAAA